MKTNPNRQHVTDLIFVLALFCVFAVSSILLVTLGSKVYRHIVHTSDENFDTRTPSAYLIEKFRQNEGHGRISLLNDFGDGSTIVMTDFINGQPYETKIYLDQGNLKELFSKKDANLSPSAGDIIVSCKEFQVKEIKDSFYHIVFITQNGQKLSIYLTNKGGVQNEPF